MKLKEEIKFLRQEVKLLREENKSLRKEIEELRGIVKEKSRPAFVKEDIKQEPKKSGQKELIT